MGNEKLDKLALRMSRFIDGEDLLDIATVCARVIAFAINESYDDPAVKCKTMSRLIEFMRNDLEHMMQTDNLQ
jgi:hypothetical protein